MGFFRSGSRIIMEDKHFPRRMALCALALGECIEHKGRFLDELVNVIFMICEETYWGLSAHMRDEKNIPSGVKHNLDLFAGETGADLALVRYVLYDELNEHVPDIIERLDRELQARIITPFFTDFDLWWMGHHGRSLNNWTPWVILNVLVVLSYFEKDERTLKSGVQLAINNYKIGLLDHPAIFQRDCRFRMCAIHAFGNDNTVIIFFIILNICYRVRKNQGYIVVFFSVLFLCTFDNRCCIFIKITITSNKKGHIQFCLY